jgi:hypothetical protein
MANHEMGGGNGMPQQQQQQQQGGVGNSDPKSMNASSGVGGGKYDSDDVNGKENANFGCSDTGNEDNGEGDTPAVVIYMVDPFSLGADENPDLLRMSCLGLLRSFSQMLPHLSDLLRHNIFLQLVSVQVTISYYFHGSSHM